MTSWALLTAIVLALAVALAIAMARRSELRAMARAVREREAAERSGGAKAQLQHPVIDLSRCLGCGTCIEVCPEDGVLDLVHGQAAVVGGARCQGVSACERECPVGAITITMSNLETRDDIPALDPSLEAVGVPGLFLAGEVTAHALIRIAIEHGTRVGAAVAKRCAGAPAAEGDLHDLCIVGAGPAGFACALEARRLGLRFVTIDQADSLGGTVAKYPRRKLVVSEAIDLPLHGRLREGTYTKEALIDLWEELAREHELPFALGEPLAAIERRADDTFVVQSRSGARWNARHLCLAIGRRGVPRRLGVPGEDSAKVAYGLLDAQSWRGRAILVVGGGDSAVEAALGLAEQAGNRVTLSYRKAHFFRLRLRNRERLEAAETAGRLTVLRRSRVVAIHAGRVELECDAADGPSSSRSIENDDVFVMIGGEAPFELLRRAGVSFDPSQREAIAPIEERGSDLVRAAAAALVLTLATLGWALWHGDYYLLPLAERPTHDKHDLLRPASGVGLGFGVAAVVLILTNLAYLLRRSRRLRFGSLSGWMSVHVATGVLAFLCALLHGAMAPRDTVGGQAFWALLALLVTGAIGRYFYAWVPRAANGRELELAELRATLHERVAAADTDGGPAHRQFAAAARDRVLAQIERQQWRSGCVSRVFSLLGVPFALRRAVASIRAEGRTLAVPASSIAATVALARQAHRRALIAAHYEDLRALLASWRYMHRWVALLMVALAVLHVVYALSYGDLISFEPRGGGKP